MSKRKGISKRTRFEVFKRDGFCCAYCGATPPNLLEVDHIYPVMLGGTDEMDNLVTSCVECNRGKSAVPLTTVPESLAEKAERTREREEQLREYYAILQAKKDREDDEVWRIAEMYMERFAEDSILKTNLASIRMFLKRIDYFEVQEAMELAVARQYSKGPAFKYFCGICWRKIRETEGQ